MDIKLKSLRLLNFKGIQNLTIPFDTDNETNISGDNATGKTTIFDGFMWLLFGKDSRDRKDFNIKTLDKDNNPIPKIAHEVEGVILVDDREITLKRTFTEKWTKKRGSSTEEFTGHESGYFVDEVPCSQSEFNQKVSDIIDEQLFKLITNPAYFPSQKKEFQRQVLISMAGNITDAEIAFGNENFQSLLKDLSGITLEDFRRKIGAKKKMIKDQLEGIPARVDEVNRNIPEAEDWDAVSQMIADNEGKIAKIDNTILGMSKLHEINHQAKQKQFEMLTSLQKKRTELLGAIIKELSDERTKALETLLKLKGKRQLKEAEYERRERNQFNLTDEVARLEAEVTLMRGNWQAEFGKQLVFDNADFICPTCKRAFEQSDVESKKSTLLQNFNTEKTRRLQTITEKGQALNKKLDEAKIAASKETEMLNQLETELQSIDDEIAVAKDKVPAGTDYATEAAKHNDIVSLDRQIIEAQVKANEPVPDEDNDDLIQRKEFLQKQINELQGKLALKEVIERSENRIRELESEQVSLNQELATLEQKEFTLAEFSKAKISEVEKRTNSMFRLVKFKLFESQINGGEAETCEAMVNGVPYSDLNNAMKINAGLDIINALCAHHEVTAPIFIDNRESVTELTPCPSQIINLFVVKGLELSF